MATSLSGSITSSGPRVARNLAQPLKAVGPKARRESLVHVRHSSTSTLIGTPHTPTTARTTDSPLSELPSSVLWRSLLINAVSSRPWLLIPSLSLLQRFSRPGNPFLINVERNPVLRSILKQTFYKQFCAGETGAETQETMRQLQDMGFRGTILTYAKETVFDCNTNEQLGLGVDTSCKGEAKWNESIKAWQEGTVKTVELLREGDQLAVKLTGAGPSVCEAFANGAPLPQQMLDALHEISQKCKERGAYILIDAESQHYQWGIFSVGMDLMRKYNRDGHAVIYNTYQAYLKSTPDTLAKHLAMATEDGFTHGLKVVRGAYMASDPRNLIHDTKQDTDDAFNSIAQGALRQELGQFGASGGRPFPSLNLLLASHNKESLVAAHQLHQQRTKAGLPTVPVKFAQLHGMSDEVSFGLLKLKDESGVAPEVYKCSTWGTLAECLAYLTRRAMENRDAASRTRDEYSALKSEAWRRVAFWR